MDSEAGQILHLVAAINEAWLSGRADELAAYFHEDMVITGPGYKLMCRGREACVRSYREFAAATKVLQYTESDMQIEAWGGTALGTYSWSMSYEQEGEPKTECGTDQFFFARQDGRWLALWRYINFTPA